MKEWKIQPFVILLVPIFMVLVTMNAGACPNCYGASDSSQTAGLNMAILSLLGFIGLILGAIILFVLYYVRRQRTQIVDMNQ